MQKRFGAKQALAGVDLTVRRGEVVAVLGANGCGKSTLLRCALRLIEPDGGDTWLGERELNGLGGRDLRDARARAAMIFQNVNLVRRRSAIQNVAYGGFNRLSARRSVSHRLFPPQLVELAATSLDRVGLADVALQRVDTLSGGQAQRVAIARALCQQADVILADEPVASLDPAAANAVLALLQRIAKEERIGVACVLHQPELALQYADRIVGMEAGRVVFDARPNAVSSVSIDDLYRSERHA
jgi:phosphonate transport system ATP-binding protein